LPLEVAVGSTLIIRFGTLWFGIMVGRISYILLKTSVKKFFPLFVFKVAWSTISCLTFIFNLYQIKLYLNSELF